jgi:hypothetical protein
MLLSIAARTLPLPMQACSSPGRKRSSCWSLSKLQWQQGRSCRVAAGRTSAPAAQQLHLDWRAPSLPQLRRALELLCVWVSCCLFHEA